MGGMLCLFQSLLPSVYKEQSYLYNVFNYKQYSELRESLDLQIEEQDDYDFC